MCFLKTVPKLPVYCILRDREIVCIKRVYTEGTVLMKTVSLSVYTESLARFIFGWLRGPFSKLRLNAKKIRLHVGNMPTHNGEKDQH